MLSIENVSYDGEWVMDAPGSTITVRENRDPGDPNLTFSLEVYPSLDLSAVSLHPLYSSGSSPAPRKWKTSSRQRKWCYLLRDDSGGILYRAIVEDTTIVNTVNGREFGMVSYELDYSGPDSADRRFTASGTEPDRITAIRTVGLIARQHHSGLLPDTEDWEVQTVIPLSF